jgi:hypothetical protein
VIIHKLKAAATAPMTLARWKVGGVGLVGLIFGLFF